MILKNRTQESAYFSKSNNFIGLAFVFIIVTAALIYLRENIQANILYLIIPLVWILIEIFLTVKNIKKGQMLNLTGIEEICLEKDFIKIKNTQEGFKQYSYVDLKCVNIQIETYLCHSGGTSGNCLATSIKGTKIDFILKNDDIKSINIFYYSRIGFINAIKKILKILKSKTSVNIKYFGSGNISEIKNIVEK